MRPDRGAYFLAGAAWAATRGECTRRKVGALIVDPEGRVRGHGYNGAMPGAPSCLEGACPRGRLTYLEAPAGGSYENCVATHAEVNALWATDPRHRAGATVYVSSAPCGRCLTVCRSVGAVRVVHPDGEVDL